MMTDYTNAPAPQGDVTTPATRIYRDGKGCRCSHDVFMQYGRPIPLELALRRVAIGRTVFVQPGDAETVLDAVRGGGNGETVP